MQAVDFESIAAFRRELHANPELSEQETGTAQAICERLRQCKPDPLVHGLGSMGTGVCAVFDSGKPGPTVLIRAELDALPIQETNTFAHRSMSDGVSHKCGHDGHMATLIAVAESLHAEPVTRGRVMLLFQPAEETGTGAAAVIADERFQALGAPDFVYAFHNVPRQPLGQVLVRDEVFAQGSAGFIARFHGTTSHSSYPEHGVNPSRAVTTLIDAVNRFDGILVDQVNGPVLGTITGAKLGAADIGSNFGITPGEASVTGVVRAHHGQDLALLREELSRIVAELADQDGLGHSLSWHEEFAVTASNADCVDLVIRAAEATGLEVERIDEPFRWSEDFGYFTSSFRGAFFGLGSGHEQPQLHDDGYDYPDSLIEMGARLYRAIIDATLAECRTGNDRSRMDD